MRAARVVALLDQATAADAGPLAELAKLAPLFRAWRGSLRRGDRAAADEAAGRAARAMEAGRLAILERDRGIRAYRVRWACDNETLGARGLMRLLRFYRLLPYSLSSQSKFEFVLTRLFAGPLRAQRALVAPAGELVERLRGFEQEWGARAVVVPDGELAETLADLAGLAREAAAHASAPAYGESALQQRAGAYKAGLREKLFDPRIAVATVECTVALGNAFCELLAKEGAAAEAVSGEPVSAPPPEAPYAARDLAEEEEVRTAEASGDEVALDRLERMERLLDPAGGEATRGQPWSETHDAAPAAAAESAEAPAAAPPPSARAGDWAKLPENAPVIGRYLEPGRSTEVYKLDLDRFLEPLPAAARERLGGGDEERRRALDQILSADDLVRELGGSEDRSDEQRDRVKELVRQMAVLGTELGALTGRAQQDVFEAVDPLLYVSDHLVWERLRLESSTRAVARRRRAKRPAGQAIDALARGGLSRGGKLVAAVLGLAALATSIVGVMGAVVEPRAVDREVRVVDPKALPLPEQLLDARFRRSVLYVTVRPSWSWMGESARRDHVRDIARLAASAGIRTVTLSDAAGEVLASFAGGQVTLATDPIEP